MRSLHFPNGPRDQANEINDSTFVAIAAIIVHGRPTLRYFSYQIVSLRLYSKIPTTLSVAVAHHLRTRHLLTQDNLRERLNLPHGKNDTWGGWDSFVRDNDGAIPDFRSNRA